MPSQGEKIKETVVLILLNIGLPSVDVGSDIALMIKFYIGSRSNLWCDEKYKYSDNQFLNCKLSKTGKPVGEESILRQSCYQDINRICKELKIDSITEKMCKSLGTRYI